MDFQPLDLINDFASHEKRVSDYVRSCISGYRQSNCYKLLDRRMNDLRMSADLKPASLRRNEYISHVVFPLVLEQYRVNSAILSSNYRAQEIFNLTATGSTPPENSMHAETVLNLNMANTFFKMKALKPAINNAALFGTSVMYTYWRQDQQPKIGTMYDQQTGQYKRVTMPNRQANSQNVMIDLRDYFQDPDQPDADLSSYQGHTRKVMLSELTELMHNEAYITDNLGGVIDKARNGILPTGARTENERQDPKHRNKFTVEIDRYEGVLPIKGNEMDSTRYCVEMIGQIIIRLSIDDYDDEISSYTVMNLCKRPEYWWGNSECEYKLPHENFLNVMLSMTADNALKSMQQYVFYNGGHLSMDDITNRDAMNGFIPVDAKNIPLSQLVLPYQPGVANYNAVEYAVNAVNESASRMGTSIDFSRNNAGGTQNNKTATGAQIMAGQADMIANDRIENFDFAVCDIGRKNTILLQQFLSEIFYIRPKADQVEHPIAKYMMLGRFQYIVNSTVSKNKQNEMVRLQNLVTWLSNLLGNPQLAQAGYKLVPAINDVIRRADLPSIDEILPNENQQAMAGPGGVPSAQGAAQAMGGAMMPIQGAGMPQMAMAGGGR